MYVFKPEYYDKFHCIGPDCTLTCCVGWEIAMSEANYKTYLSLPGELGEIAKKYFTPTPSGDKYILNPNDNDDCPYYKEGLCRIVAEVGDHAISDICATFPRDSIFLNETLELNLTNSCPHVVELLREIKHPLEFIMEDSNFSDYKKETPTEVAKNDFDLSIRNTMIDLLQNRAYPLWFRLFAVVFSMHKTEAAFLSDQRDEAESLLNDFVSENHLQALFSSISKSKTITPEQISFFQKLTLQYQNAFLSAFGKGARLKWVKGILSTNNSISYDAYCTAYMKSAPDPILNEHLAVNTWYAYSLLKATKSYLYDTALAAALEHLLISHIKTLAAMTYGTLSETEENFIIALCARASSHNIHSTFRLISGMKEDGSLSPGSILYMLTPAD